MPGGAAPDVPPTAPWRRVSWLVGRYAVCRFDAGSEAADRAAIAAPGSSPKALGLDELFSVTQSAEEVSVVCTERRVSGEAAGTNVERGWSVMRLDGPIPFDQVGVLASLATPLAAARVGIFAVSTFDTDYVLVQASDAPRAQAALEAAGFTFREASSPPAEAPASRAPGAS
jgi:hypothetical protein